MQRYKKGILICLVCIMAFMPVSAMALKVTHSGILSTSAIIKDIDGFQSGFLNDYNEFVSQYNYIKINLNIVPEYAVKPKLRFDRAFMSYRGGYDSIYDLSDRYNGAPTNVDTSNFKFGRDEMRFENDLREITVDFVYEAGDTNWKLRAGRQITIWGEADILALVNVVNPSNRTNTPGSTFPEDTAYPTWQIRLEMSTLDVGPFEQVGLQLLAIPDVVPDLWSEPGTAFGFPIPFVHNTGHSGAEDMEFGARLGFDIGQVHGDFYFFEGYQKGFAIQWAPFLADMVNNTLIFDHPKSTMVGTSGQYYSDWARGIFRWEAAYKDGSSVANAFDPSGKFYTLFETWEGLVSFDRPWHFSKIFRTRSAQNSTLQLYTKHYASHPGQAAMTFPAPLLNKPPEKNMYFITWMWSTDYNNGRVKPSVALVYDPLGVMLTSISCTVIRKDWRFKIAESSVWGNTTSVSPFAALIPGSTLTFTVEYNF